jgi:hypothetical protein
MDTWGGARAKLALMLGLLLGGCSPALASSPIERARPSGVTLPPLPDRAALSLRAHPAIDAYRLSVAAWATAEESARFARVDVSHTFTARAIDLQSLAMDRLVHRVVPLVLEAQRDPALRARGQRLRALALDAPALRRLDPREVFAALSARHFADEGEAARAAAAMRLHAEAVAEFAEAYARAVGVSSVEADRVALAVDGVGTVGLLLGKIAECPGVPRARVVDEAERLLADLVRTARGAR